jgi:hypothetical protein
MQQQEKIREFIAAAPLPTCYRLTKELDAEHNLGLQFSEDFTPSEAVDRFTMSIHASKEIFAPEIGTIELLKLGPYRTLFQVFLDKSGPGVLEEMGRLMGQLLMLEAEAAAQEARYNKAREEAPKRMKDISDTIVERLNALHLMEP